MKGLSQQTVDKKGNTMTYTEYLQIATKGLPSHIDYVKYLGQSNKSNQYSNQDALNAKAICKTVARILIK